MRQYTKDIARALGELLRLRPSFGIYHMVNEGYCSWYESTKAIFGILGWDVRVKPINSSELKRLAKRPKFSALKNEKLEKLLKMKHWRETLGEYLKEKGYL
ncbi:dTDP-4-dehydrorhamnose reductase [Pyrococcus sp. NA2]|uniref:sugar nucleotide-binding protein n=1 Tax=Pyrococcus sp. (strain NA2) TaxID=342949 RepID=UPI000209AA05|nr:dTDP-4-dehydrorhamnose reductase [Pyrococcus sp. NA2]